MVRVKPVYEDALTATPNVLGSRSPEEPTLHCEAPLTHSGDGLTGMVKL